MSSKAAVSEAVSFKTSKLFQEYSVSLASDILDWAVKELDLGDVLREAINEKWMKEGEECEEGKETDIVLKRWARGAKSVKKVSSSGKKKAAIADEDQCTHLKEDGKRCGMKRWGEKGIENAKEGKNKDKKARVVGVDIIGDPDMCHIHNKISKTPKKGNRKAPEPKEDEMSEEELEDVISSRRARRTPIKAASGKTKVKVVMQDTEDEDDE